MGGVPLLLMAVAMGITYGWQPDGNGGVDYIIQIPPDQIDQVRSSGTISSVIDPQIRGHVSRVIVKVGNEPLARITPDELVRKRDTIVLAAKTSASDLAAVPVPETQTPLPRSVAMKPDVNDPGRGPGMSLPPSLANAAGGATGSATQAGSGLRDAMSDLSADLAQRTRSQMDVRAAQAKSAAAGMSEQTSEALRNQLAGQNRSANPRYSTQNTGSGQAGAGQAGANPNRQLPPFTGQGNDNVARIRTGGPTTAPANARDKKWFDMSAKTGQRGPSTDPVNNTKSAWPEMTGPPDLRAKERQMPATQGSTNELRRRDTTSQQPLGSTATFARIPDGLTPPNSGQRSSSDARTMSITDYERAQYERQLQQQRAAQNATGNLGYPNREPTFGGLITNTSDDRAGGIGLPGSQSSLLRPASRESVANQQQFDPRLSRADIARLPYGAWSMDAHGNPIDREGRILDQYGRPVSQQRAYELTRGRASSPVSLDRPTQDSFAQPTGGTQTGLASRASLDQPFDRIAQRRANGTPQGDSSRSVSSSSDRVQPNTRSDSSRDYLSANTLTKNRHTLAAQPLFNGLLLMSIVANVYLIFWLKNLRHQFRDLVASKRAATSELAA